MYAGILTYVGFQLNGPHPLTSSPKIWRGGKGVRGDFLLYGKSCIIWAIFSVEV
jgi:hypothetical protein